MRFYVYTDGGARGNPGPAAIGVVIKKKDENNRLIEVESFGKYLGERLTNNQAEYLALIEGLEALTKHRAREAVFFLDSELVVNQLIGRYRVKDKGLQSLYAKAKPLLDRLGTYSLRHISREDNYEADAMVNEALDRELQANPAYGKGLVLAPEKKAKQT